MPQNAATHLGLHCLLTGISMKNKIKKKTYIAIISEDEKIIQTSMKHFLLLLLRNATKHNSIKFSAARLHVSSDKF